jgi:hypothetical protein
MDFGNRASSNYLSNIESESGSMNFVEDLVRLESEAAGDDFLLDLGGAAEAERNSYVMGRHRLRQHSPMQIRRHGG